MNFGHYYVFGLNFGHYCVFVGFGFLYFNSLLLLTYSEGSSNNFMLQKYLWATFDSFIGINFWYP